MVQEVLLLQSCMKTVYSQALADELRQVHNIRLSSKFRL